MSSSARAVFAVLLVLFVLLLVQWRSQKWHSQKWHAGPLQAQRSSLPGPVAKANDAIVANTACPVYSISDVNCAWPAGAYSGSPPLNNGTRVWGGRSVAIHPHVWGRHFVAGHQNDFLAGDPRSADTAREN